jgi:hypothetical protein
MNGKVPSAHTQRRNLSAHLAAGVSALLLSVPIATFLNKSEAVGVWLTTAVLILMYGILFLVFRAMGAVAPKNADASSTWVAMVTGLSVFLVGATWSTWVWLMGAPLGSLSTYLSLLIGIVSLWCALAAGAIVQVKTMRTGSVRVVA